MSVVQIQGNAGGTGTMTIASPNTNSNYTATLPTRTGTLGMEGPAFIAYSSANQTLTSGTAAKVAIDTELFDTNSCYDTTNYRFLPTVAGYYQVNATFRFFATSATITQAAFFLYKTGSVYATFSVDSVAASTFTANASNRSGSVLVYLNGSTDYIELWAQITGTSPTLPFGSTANTSFFSASLVRGA